MESFADRSTFKGIGVEAAVAYRECAVWKTSTKTHRDVKNNGNAHGQTCTPYASSASNQAQRLSTLKQGKQNKTFTLCTGWSQPTPYFVSFVFSFL